MIPGPEKDVKKRFNLRLSIVWVITYRKLVCVGPLVVFIHHFLS